MRGLIRFLAVLAVVASLCAQGCSPSVLCVVETEILPDYSCTRVTRMEAFPNPNYQAQRPRLGEWFQFPPAELFDSYAVQQDKALFAGDFNSFEQIPRDIVRITPGTNALAHNIFSFRVMDMVLFVLADFDETITDIVKSQEDGEAAMTELIRLIVPEVMAVLNAKYGQRYDLSRLESWLYNDLPMKLRRIYAGAWVIHASKRSGVTSPSEDLEFYLFLRAEAQREGLELAEPNHPNMQQENLRRLKEYGIRLAQQLCTPRQGGAGVDSAMLSEVALDELLASLQQAVSARHGSINNYMAKIAALAPRAFGSYLTGTMMPLYMLPETSYRYRLRVPGMVIQTNGVRELNGDVVWNFVDRHLAFTGQSMWVRSIFVREPAVAGLGLQGFPASLGDVDKLFGLLLTPTGAPREELIKTLRDAVQSRSLSPLAAVAGKANSDDALAARGILELFENHKRAQAAGAVSQQRAGGQPPPPAAPAPIPAPEPPPVQGPTGLPQVAEPPPLPR